MGCNNICQRSIYQPIDMRYKIGGKSYKDGWKYCSVCGRFLFTTLIRCPCCSYILRTRARMTLTRKKRVLELELKSKLRV